jgi:hypothetical protein
MLNIKRLALIAATALISTLYAANPAIYAQDLAPPAEIEWESDPTDMAAYGGNYQDFSYGLWTNWEFLVTARSDSHVPPLVTTAPNNGVLPQAAILFGNEAIGGEARPAGRLTIGTWLDLSYSWALEGRALVLSEQTVRFGENSSSTAVLARPFVNLTPIGVGIVGEDALVIAAPGVATGSISVDHKSNVATGDITFRRLLYESTDTEVDLLLGYVMSRIDEELLIRSDSTIVPVGATLQVFDLFDTENEFHGGHFGFDVKSFEQNWSLGLRGQVAFGTMSQLVRIRGQQAGAVTPGGLYAQPTNIGDFERNRFAISPEFDLTLGYKINANTELSVGYTVIHWDRVVQAGNQIDATINPNQPPPLADPQRPAFMFRETDYTVHGLTVGLKIDF